MNHLKNYTDNGSNTSPANLEDRMSEMQKCQEDIISAIFSRVQAKILACNQTWMSND